MIKTNIKMRVTPEQSKRVQEICFENGFIWATSGKKFQYFYEWIFIDKERLYCYSSLITEEVSADLFIKTNGTCEETYLTKYTSQPKDLESALKKIENLHIALNKKVEKNKNQALEITKLLEQKKAMIYDINIAINHLLEMKELKEKLKEKNTIISYLESKLK